MEQSILTSTKKMLGLSPDDPSFDHDVITHINGAFSTLQQMGVGPTAGFVIEDDTSEWDSFLLVPQDQMSAVKVYIHAKVRLTFDPPTTSFHLAALQNQIKEYEWRINSRREETYWTDPDPDAIELTDELVDIDGGGA